MDSDRNAKAKGAIDEGKNKLREVAGEVIRGKALQASALGTQSRRGKEDFWGIVELTAAMKTLRTLVLFVWFGLFALAPGCERTPSGAPALAISKLTPANYAKITTGMTKAQVGRIMGSPTTMETKDMIVFKKTTYRYEEGSKFAVFTFKNDELDSKDGNLTAP
ncbi:MAG TPA: outer membrane protein assembly factor BamE [Pyrinomonadaceae bacterium]|nr:outer membrane protein assembly factor BamE [Pyrinomonadaceae bacterium]